MENLHLLKSRPFFPGVVFFNMSVFLSFPFGFFVFSCLFFHSFLLFLLPNGFLHLSRLFYFLFCLVLFLQFNFLLYSDSLVFCLLCSYLGVRSRAFCFNWKSYGFRELGVCAGYLSIQLCEFFCQFFLFYALRLFFCKKKIMYNLFTCNLSVPVYFPKIQLLIVKVLCGDVAVKVHFKIIILNYVLNPQNNQKLTQTLPLKVIFF